MLFVVGIFYSLEFLEWAWPLFNILGRWSPPRLLPSLGPNLKMIDFLYFHCVMTLSFFNCVRVRSSRLLKKQPSSRRSSMLLYYAGRGGVFENRTGFLSSRPLAWSPPISWHSGDVSAIAAGMRATGSLVPCSIREGRSATARVEGGGERCVAVSMFVSCGSLGSVLLGCEW